MIIPNTNINLATNIRDVLNNAGGTVGNDVSSFFTTAAKINPYSKRKPVPLAVNFCQDFDDTEPHYYKDWWKGSDGYCGFIPCQVSSFKNIPSYMDGDMNGWSYQLPVGGSKTPMRLGDFRGYSSEADPMVSGFTVPSIVSNQFSSNVVTGTCMYTFESDTNLTFADFPNLKDYYFGMYIVQENGSQYRYKTTTIPLEQGACSVSISSYGLPTGKWTAYPFISEAIQDGNTQVASVYYTIPGNDPATFTVVNSLVTLIVHAEKVSLSGVLPSDKNAIKVEVYVRSSGGPTKFTNNYLQIRYADKDFYDDMVVGEISKQLDDITVPNDGTTTLVHSMTYTVADDDVYDNCKVWVSLQSSNYKTGILPAESIEDSDDQA